MATKQISVSRAEGGVAPSHEVRDSGRHQIPLRDLAECLLAAYEGVSARAFRLHQAKGAEAGSELKVWKEAERDLLGAMPVDLAETGENFYALASVPGYSAAEISVAVEDCWLLISGYGHSFGQTGYAVGDAKFDETGIIGRQGEASAADASGENVGPPLSLQSDPCVEQRGEGCAVRRPFCVVELGRRVDASRSIAVIANGMVAVRIAKAEPGAITQDKKARE
ncbi:MAG: Hsp20/alpha crystallin family protein [Candidatus Acidiferrales bacterium]